MTVQLLVNIDVPDIAKAEAFYTAALGLKSARRFGDGALELTGAGSAVYLLRNAAGTVGAGNSKRTYERHWTPIHLDFVVDDIDTASTRALTAGAKKESRRNEKWGKIATFSDPFGHGFCVIEFVGHGYDEIAN